MLIYEAVRERSQAGGMYLVGRMRPTGHTLPIRWH